ncbi:MAG: hypothetical protein RL434_30 [Pseudomonadota bacterium]
MKIIVAVATLGRPRLLGELLDSFIDMEHPESTDVTFLVVENDAIARSASIVDSFKSRVGKDVVHLNEARRGIPFARNAALEWALGQNADVLCFVDDDGEVSRDWLKNLVGTLIERQLDLVGGPIRPVPAEPLKSRRAAAVLAGWQSKYGSMQHERHRLSASGEDGQFNIYTHNWAARLDIIRKTGLRFDETMLETGGSDSAFSIALRAAGGRSGWAGNAAVIDKLPTDRLTFSYMWRRGLSQGMISAALAKNLPSGMPLLMSARIIAGMIIFLASDRGRSIQSLYSLAFQWGQWLGLRGRKARQYNVSQA